MTTTRERREARIERLRGWAAKRETRAAASYERAHSIASAIPFGQPVLVGHHSERSHRAALDRIDRGMRDSIESTKMAQSMTERAENIQRALDRSIFSDDEDAVQKLEEKIKRLEQERLNIKLYNASCRNGTPDTSLLNECQRADLENMKRVCAYMVGSKGEMPSYVASNLSGNIATAKKRLASLSK